MYYPIRITYKGPEILFSRSGMKNQVPRFLVVY